MSDGTHLNPLGEYFRDNPSISKRAFAELIGVCPSYVSQLSRQLAPRWPSRRVIRKIAEVTNGQVTANDLAAFPAE